MEEQKKTMRVVLVQPDKLAEIAEIEAGLAGMQKVVGGYIEDYCPFEDTVSIICNEEGKLCGLPLNRAIKAKNGEIVEIIAGTFFVCDNGEENFESLSEEHQKKYLEIFQYPEHFFRTSRGITAIPFKPC